MGVEAAEKQGNAPQPGDADQRVNDAAADARLPAEDGGDQVKPKMPMLPQLSAPTMTSANAIL